MRVIVAAVGRPRSAELSAAIRHYEERAARYWSLEAREVRAERSTALEPSLVRDREAERLLDAAGEAALLVACDAGGELLTSEAFASWLRTERDRARDLAFLIGGAFGLGDAVVKRAAKRLAFARWTLPHELARLVLAEQLYRAGTIVRGEPYHK
ncbi:MAG TPA: 23S rRNA (pseudouridine(1915)-N(3))-methyltransferase RlmH [Gemmatimonadaceae bacterium]|nr:23S rRNA (pseudouridine(1915)-N(3))-methyltransferase RlmH [Gemmatimonadaceae bacterium]